jgi:LacI family transcriptional regulator
MSITRVAKLAGVSSSTVSRVINNSPRVAPETVDSVRKAMAELNYTPSDRRPGPKPAGRSRSTAATIAFLVLGANRNRATPAFEDLLHGLSQASSQHDLNLVFNHVTDPEQLPARVVGQKVDGLLLHGSAPGVAVREKLGKVPTVWVMGNRRRPDWGDQVMVDGYEVGELAAKYLAGRGHKELVFLNLDSGHWLIRLYGHAFKVTGEEQGGRVRCLEQQRQVSANYWQEHSPEAVEQLVSSYMDLSPRPTGIFVADDMQVAMIQPALQRRGVELGAGKTEVISCNNEKPYLMGLDPRPAVVDIRVESIGKRAIDQLIWRLDHPGVTERIVTTVEPLVVGHEGAV